MRIVDLHSHVLPGVDDGAQDLDEAIAGLEALAADGVERVVATPHFRGSLLERPPRAAARLERFDAAHRMLVERARARGLDVAVDRACEFKLDVPEVDLSDPRLRLAGTRYALVEFASFQLPPYAGNQLRAVIDAGWTPLLAHPERYFGVEGALDRVAEWVEAGVLLQVNLRSLAGGYGPVARRVSAELLAAGRVCSLASDYHCRDVPGWGEAVPRLREAEGAAVPCDGPAGKGPSSLAALLGVNADLILGDEPPMPAGPIRLSDGGRGAGRRRWF